MANLSLRATLHAVIQEFQNLILPKLLESILALHQSLYLQQFPTIQYYIWLGPLSDHHGSTPKVVGNVRWSTMISCSVL